jgi:hypothetical protein
VTATKPPVAVDPALGSDAVRAHVALRQAEAELTRYIDTSSQLPAAEQAAGINERLARIRAARAVIVATRGTLAQADDHARAYRAELEKLETRHARAVARLDKRYGRAAP